jgi:hypothetical protein
MADTELRADARRRLTTGDAQDEARHLNRRRRAGELPDALLELYALLGHRVARLAIGVDPDAPIGDFASPAVAEASVRELCSDPKHGLAYETRRTSLLMCYVPAGATRLGADQDDRRGFDDEKPARVLWTSEARHLARDSVDLARFQRFVAETGYQPAGRPSAVEGGDAVVQITWHDARAWCAWEGLRLPHENEWEHAARGYDSRIYPWGSEWIEDRERRRAATSPFGQRGLCGEVWQWCGNEYHSERWADLGPYRIVAPAHMRGAHACGDQAYEVELATFCAPVIARPADDSWAPDARIDLSWLADDLARAKAGAPRLPRPLPSTFVDSSVAIQEGVGPRSEVEARGGRPRSVDAGSHDPTSVPGSNPGTVMLPRPQAGNDVRQGGAGQEGDAGLRGAGAQVHAPGTVTLPRRGGDGHQGPVGPGAPVVVAGRPDPVTIPPGGRTGLAGGPGRLLPPGSARPAPDGDPARVTVQAGDAPGAGHAVGADGRVAGGDGSGVDHGAVTIQGERGLVQDERASAWGPAAGDAGPLGGGPLGGTVALQGAAPLVRREADGADAPGQVPEPGRGADDGGRARGTVTLQGPAGGSRAAPVARLGVGEDRAEPRPVTLQAGAGRPRGVADDVEDARVAGDHGRGRPVPRSLAGPVTVQGRPGPGVAGVLADPRPVGVGAEQDPGFPDRAVTLQGEPAGELAQAAPPARAPADAVLDGDRDVGAAPRAVTLQGPRRLDAPAVGEPGSLGPPLGEPGDQAELVTLQGTDGRRRASDHGDVAAERREPVVQVPDDPPDQVTVQGADDLLLPPRVGAVPAPRGAEDDGDLQARAAPDPVTVQGSVVGDGLEPPARGLAHADHDLRGVAAVEERPTRSVTIQGDDEHVVADARGVRGGDDGAGGVVPPPPVMVQGPGEPLVGRVEPVGLPPRPADGRVPPGQVTVQGGLVDEAVGAAEGGRDGLAPVAGHDEALPVTLQADAGGARRGEPDGPAGHGRVPAEPVSASVMLQGVGPVDGPAARVAQVAPARPRRAGDAARALTSSSTSAKLEPLPGWLPPERPPFRGLARTLGLEGGRPDPQGRRAPGAIAGHLAPRGSPRSRDGDARLMTHPPVRHPHG